MECSAVEVRAAFLATSLAVPTLPYGRSSAIGSLAVKLGGSNLTLMTKSQQRELKVVLAAIGRTLRPESFDDVVRILVYRAQTIADEACAAAAHAQVHKAG